MAAIYGNSEFMKNKRSHHMDKSAQEREVTSAKRMKVLLIVLAVSLGFALGGICALSLLYAGKLSSCDTQKDNVLKRPQHQINQNERDLLEKYNKVKERLATFNKFVRSNSCKLCEDGWTLYGKKCYFFSSNKQKWFESRDSCKALKAHLVTIKKKTEQEFLVSKIKETHWIGLTDQETEGRWVWVDNQTLEETKLQFWFNKSWREPDNWVGPNPSGEDCACLGYEVHLNYWFDMSCEIEKKFICEKEYSFPFADD